MSKKSADKLPEPKLPTPDEQIEPVQSEPVQTAPDSLPQAPEEILTPAPEPIPDSGSIEPEGIAAPPRRN